jgi:AcrR family transcriptional regulator
MPYPAQIDLDTILETARGLIEESGVDALSLGRLAADLGVKAPSLYRHVANKDALIQGVSTQLVTHLFEAIDEAVASAGDAPEDRLMAAARSYRRFAHANPRTFVLAMTDDEPASQPDPDYLVELILPLQEIVAEMVGEENSLPALRGLYAVMHGFVLAELTGQFRRGGDLDAAFDGAVSSQIRGWQRG